MIIQVTYQKPSAIGQSVGCTFLELCSQLLYEINWNRLKDGEIVFFVQSLESDTRYLVEVKAGKGTAVTALKALQQGKADWLLYLKGNTKGGTEKKIHTLPIYLLEQYHFL